MDLRLIRALVGISSCATRCICCEAHARVARQALEEYRYSLSNEDAWKLDNIIHDPFSLEARDSGNAQ